MNVNKGLLAILATAALAAAKKTTNGSNAKSSELAIGSSGDVFRYYGFNLKMFDGDYIISPVLLSMGKTLGFDSDTIDAIRLYEEDLKIGQANPDFKQEYDEVQDTLDAVLRKRFFVAEMSYYLENDIPIVSEFIRLNLKGTEPFHKGRSIVKGQRGKSQKVTQMMKGGGPTVQEDDYLPIYQRLPKQMDSEAGQQEFFKALLTSPYNETRSGYLDTLMNQMGNLINVKIADLIMVPKDQISHLGDANFENPSDFFSTKSLNFRRIKSLLLEARRSNKKEFSYLSDWINADGTGDLYRAVVQTYKIRKHRTNFKTFVISTGNFQNRKLEYVQIPDVILSGVAANKSQWGVLEKIRYSKDYVRNPTAFSLYVRAILGLRQTLSMDGAKSASIGGINVYALDPRGDDLSAVEGIELNTDPFRFDPVTGEVSLCIMQWAEHSIKKMISLKKLLLNRRQELIEKQHTMNVFLYASQVQETILSFLDMVLYNKIILSWKQAGNKVTSEILDDLHLLTIGFLYRINKNFYDAGETPLTISAICDAYSNSLIPFGTATVESYEQALNMCIAGVGIPEYISYDCVEEDYTTEGLGFLVDKVCYDVSTSNNMLYLVSEETIATAQSLTPYFTYRYFEQGSCILSYKGLRGQQTILMHKYFVLTAKEGIIPVQGGGAVAVAQQGVQVDLNKWSLYFSYLTNAYNLTNTKWTAEKLFGYHMDIGSNPYFVKDEFSLLSNRLRILGYWFSRTCIHLYRTLKSSQRSLSWYLMSTIISPDAVDIGIEKYINEGLIDPQIFPQIAGRMLEDKSWEELSQNKYFDSVSIFKKIQATMKMILKRLSSYTQMQVRNFTKFNFEPINGSSAQQAWGEIVNRFMIVSGNALPREQVSSLGIDIGDGYFLSLNKSKISRQRATKNAFIDVSTKIFKRRGLIVNFPQGVTLEERLDICINQANEIIKLGAKANKRLVDIIFNIEKSSPFVSILHKDSIALLPKPIIQDNGEPLAGYKPVFFGRNFRNPYISFSGLNKNSQPEFDGLVQVWEDGRITEQVQVVGQQAPNPKCEIRFRVKTSEGTLLAGQKLGMYGENEKNFSAHFADAKDNFRNLLLVNQLFTDVAKRMGYVDNGDHNDPKNINSVTLEQFLRAIGFYGSPQVDLEQIIADIGKSTEVIQDQVISFFKLNKVPFVKGSSLQAYQAFLRESNGKPIHEAEQALKNLAVTIGIPLFPYIAIDDDEDIHENDHIYGQYNLMKQQKTVFNNYNNEYVPIVSADNEFSKQSFSRGMRQQKAAFVQLQKVQSDYHTFKEGINILGCQVYFNTLAELMRQMGQTQLDSFGAIGENGMPLYLKVREEKDGVLGILSDDPMGFATMYQVLASHGQILESGKRTIVKKVANPSRMLANSLASGDMDLDAEQLSLISNLLSNSNFKNIAQYPTWNNKDEVIDWNGINSKIDRAIIEIAGPLSNHQSKISQANKWSKSLNEIDKGKSKVYWDKYERLSKNVLENKDSLQALLDIKDLVSSKLPKLDMEIFDWKGLINYPNALINFRNYILQDIKGFTSFPGEVSNQVFSQQAASYQQALARKSIGYQQAFLGVLEHQAANNNGMGIRNQAYRNRLTKIYDSYLDAFDNSVVRLESERLGPLAFITPSGYRVYTPTTLENLRWVSRSSIPKEADRLWAEKNVDPSIAHYTGKLPANIVPIPSGSPTRVCIGWSSQTSYINSLQNGSQIHFVALDPAGRFTMLMSFDVNKANGSWQLSQAVNRIDKVWLNSGFAYLNSNNEKNAAIGLSREFISGAREWAKNPKSAGPEELTRDWIQESSLLWKNAVPTYLGTDAQISEGDTPMLNSGSSAFKGLSTQYAMRIPYTTSTDGSIKK